MCKVVHCKKEQYDVYIGRSHNIKNNHHWGNPFTHKTDTLADVILPNRQQAILAFKQWLDGTEYTGVRPEQRQWILDNIHTLKDKTLGCWCKPLACHGDILLELANK